MTPHLTQDRDDSLRLESDASRISLLIDDDGNVRSATWSRQQARPIPRIGARGVPREKHRELWLALPKRLPSELAVDASHQRREIPPNREGAYCRQMREGA
jgi:hypothetical protein